MAVVGRANIFLGADTASFTRKMDRARRDMASSSAKMNRSLASVDRGFKRVGREAATFGKSLVNMRSAIGLFAGTAGLGLAIKKFGEFDTSMRRIVGLVGIAEKEVNKLRTAVLKLAPEVGKGPGELADAFPSNEWPTSL